ncbi:kinase-like domain-containing protein [Blastocladiella britannica]|nr:kinase-like domain-containing protein [Blastocladiella britannica]
MQHADNFDDGEGYYRIITGETVGEGNKYRISSTLGKGVFSVVAKAVEVSTEREVAIKLVRRNETMYKAGLKEVAILRKLQDRDPRDRKHVIRLLGSFEHRGHLCMVFESMSMNLRDVLKKYGNNVGLNLKAVRLYAHQLFLALAHLRKSNIVHADLKPDNILISEDRATIKLADLGSASDASENDITPYLVSRFYRAPEIILGISYDFSIDVWSAACTLYELATGTILFPGRTNNHMLRMHMELKGPLAHKMIKRGLFGAKYFDERWQFAATEIDRITGKEVVKHVQFAAAGAGTMRGRLGRAENRDEARAQTALAELLEKCLALNPDKRLTPTDALKSAFIAGEGGGGGVGSEQSK